jgi:hypothetical protein
MMIVDIEMEYIGCFQRRNAESQGRIRTAEQCDCPPIAALKIHRVDILQT